MGCPNCHNNNNECVKEEGDGVGNCYYDYECSDCGCAWTKTEEISITEPGMEQEE